MAEGSKNAGDAAAAFNRHFDQQRASQGTRMNQQQSGPSQSFRAHQGNMNAEADFLNHQMGNLELEQGGIHQAGFYHHSPEAQSQLFSPTMHSASTSIDEAALAEARMNSAFTQPAGNFSSEMSSSSTVGPRFSPYGQEHRSPYSPMGTHGYQQPAIQYGPYGQPAGFMHGTYGQSPFAAGPASTAAASQQQQAAEPSSLAVAAAWEGAFEEAMEEWMQEQVRVEAAEEAAVTAAEAPAAEATPAPAPGPSELSATAQMLVAAVEGDTSDKFRNSNFLALMRRIAAQEVVLEGNDLVEATEVAEASTTPRPDKGKGKAVAEENDDLDKQ
ncbi:hypothetical protein E8E14_007244 [Neopestalotiopsis sp. 37M]|nr:hypothetical protein E8E14_007244 [Neopestalotiopsis sp. 37M]